MLSFTKFRLASEAEAEALKTRGLTASCGAPVCLSPVSARVLVTDDGAYTYLPASVEDKDLLKSWQERVWEECGDKAWLFAPSESLLLAGDAVIRVFEQYEGFQEGHAMKINRIILPQALLPELDTVKTIIRRANSFLHGFSSESAEKYGLRFKYNDRNAEIITV